MTLPLITPDHYARMPWYTRDRLRLARMAEVERAHDAHEDTYRPDAPTSVRDKRLTRDEFASEFEWLHSFGTPAEDIARRLGTKPSAAERRLHRAQRPDLAAVIAVAVRVARKHPCADCGEPCDHGSQRCVTCGNQARRKPVTCGRNGITQTLAGLYQWRRRLSATHTRSGSEDALAQIAEAAALIDRAHADLQAHEAECATCQARAARRAP